MQGPIYKFYRLRPTEAFYALTQAERDALLAKIGELQVWDVVNSTLMDHPFHLHGYFFQVLSVNGKEPAWRSWEDVVNLPPKSTTRIAWMPDERPPAPRAMAGIPSEIGMFASVDEAVSSGSSPMRRVAAQAAATRGDVGGVSPEGRSPIRSSN